MCSPELMQQYAQSQYAQGQAKAGVAPIPTVGPPSGAPLHAAGPVPAQGGPPPHRPQHRLPNPKFAKGR